MDEIVKRYITYVEKMIEEFGKIGNLVDEHNDVTPQRINTAMAMYYPISMALIAEYQRQKIHYEFLSLEYQHWEDEKFQEAKEKVIQSYPDNKTIKPSIKEFDTQMRRDNKEEYSKRKMELTESESRMRFLLRLMNKMDSFDKILTTLSSNARAEMRALSLDANMNASPEGVSQNKVRSRTPVARVKLEE